MDVRAKQQLCYQHFLFNSELREFDFSHSHLNRSAFWDDSWKIAALLAAISAIRDCANLMLENASYIQGELPNVEMNGTLRSQTVENL